MAENLGKFEHEVLELSPQEFARLLAHFILKAEDIKRAERKHKRK